MPPARIDPYSFEQAVAVAQDVYKQVPDWSRGEIPAIISADGKLPIVISIMKLLELKTVAAFLAGMAGLPFSNPVARPSAAFENLDDSDFD